MVVLENLKSTDDLEKKLKAPDSVTLDTTTLVDNFGVSCRLFFYAVICMFS